MVQDPQDFPGAAVIPFPAQPPRRIAAAEHPYHRSAARERRIGKSAIECDGLPPSAAGFQTLDAE